MKIKNILFYLSALSKSNLNIYPYLTALVVLGLIIPLANILFLRFITLAIVGDRAVTAALVTVSVFFVVTTAAQGIKMYLDKKLAWSGPYIKFKLRERIQQRAMTMPYPMTEDRDALNVYKAAEDAVGRAEGMLMNIASGLSAVMLVVVYSIMVLALHPLVLLLLVINAYLGYRFVAKSKLYEAAQREDRADIGRRKDYLFQTMFDYAYGKEIRLFDFGGFLLSKFMAQRDLMKKTRAKSVFVTLLYSALELLMTAVRELAVYAVLIWLFVYGTVTIDAFVMYIGLIISFSAVSRGLIGDMASLAEVDAYLASYRQFIDVVDNDDGEIELEVAAEYRLEFKNVSFGYSAERPVLHDVSFVMESGQHTSIVGLNGAGKSTIVKLICRLYEPCDGSIYLNGVDIKNYKKSSLYQHIATVFQDSRLYAFSVAENIAVSADYDEAKIRTAIEDIGMSVESLTAPVLKNLYDDGVEFSGGEVQRLCIARAMYRGGGIVLLDEPTSALDALAEKKILEGFSQVSKGRTTLFISHRMNSNRLCDKIIFIENGKVIAEGSHDDLMNRCTQYSDLYNIQAQYYI